ncbi:MAG: class I SAM-dependent methyltransferase [Planctomycetales bacterium]
MSHQSLLRHRLIARTARLERYSSRIGLNAPYLAWQLEAFRSHLGHRILEVGCGVGGIIEQLGPRELIFGVDVEPEVLDYAAERYRDRPECQFELLDLTDSCQSRLDDLRAMRFDTVICINALEHMADDRLAMQRMSWLLPPQGVVALLVPAHPSLFGNYDRLDGHYRRYTRESIGELAAAAGFAILQLRHFNALGAVGWWVQYRLLRRAQHGATHFGIMNRLIPACRLLERLAPPPFGLSLIAVLRKQEHRS